MNEKELEMRRAARDKREQEWAKSRPNIILRFFTATLEFIFYFRKEPWLNHIEPRRSYYLYGGYEAELDFDCSHKKVMDEKSERQIRLEAYRKAVKTYESTGYRPYETPITIRTYMQEKKAWREYVLNHPEDTEERERYLSLCNAEKLHIVFFIFFLVLLTYAIYRIVTGYSAIFSDIPRNINWF